MKKTMEHAILVYLALALVAYPFLFLIYEIWLFLIYEIWRSERRQQRRR
jgi:hypothetical protein